MISVATESDRALPKGWRWVKLGEVMASTLGSVDPSKAHDEVFILYSVPAFDQREPEVLPGRRIGSTKQVVKAGDVLLSKIVPHIRRSWVVSEHSGSRTIAFGEWIVFRSEMVWPDYLRHVLVSDDFHEKFMRTTSGVGGSLTRARPALVANISIPLPPLPEQKRIAAILNEQMAAVERARKAAEDDLAAINALPAALLRRAFAGEL
jgi:type I restriction enzyme S subunit